MISKTRLILTSSSLFFKVFSVPFILTNENVGSISPESSNWIGQIDTQSLGQWIDLAVVMVWLRSKWIYFPMYEC